MIVERKTHVKLRKQYKKILYLYQAHSQTFVFQGNNGVRRDFIAHVDKYGKQLFVHYFQRPIDSLGMLNEYQAIVLQTRANVISILDLKTYEWKRIPHYYLIEQSDQCLLLTFADTKYLTVVQHGRVNDNRLKLTYYNYPQKNPIKTQKQYLMHHRTQLLQKQFSVNDGQWNFQYQIVKANNHSMIIWYRDRHDQAFQFRFFRQDKDFRPLYRNDLNNMNGWEYKCVVINHKLDELYNYTKLVICMLEVFQIDKNKLMVCCLSNRDRPLIHEQPIKNQYIVDLQANTVNQSPHNLGLLHFYQIDRKLIGSCHMIKTYTFEQSMSVSSPVYYFSNNNFQKIFESQWTCSYRTKYTQPGYDAYALIQNDYENANVTQFTCRYKKLIQYKQIIMFFMLQINEDFDQDLMQDVIGLICD